VIEVLQPLTQQPGVLLAALVSSDGVPVAAPGSRAIRERSAEHASFGDPEALAALSAGWLDELTTSVGLLSCDAPRRVVLRAARGTLLLLRTSGAVLLVVLEAGLGPDALWLPMEGVVARIQRILRGMGEDYAHELEDLQPPSPLPKRAGPEERELPMSGSQAGPAEDDSVEN
jgi:predicted regulator of Ras-like GTPase activity (Roadblock/LC7/MglB family)